MKIYSACRRFSGLLFASISLVLCLWLAMAAWAGPAKFVDGQILIKPKAGVAADKIQATHKAFGSEVAHTFKNLGNAQVVRLPKGIAVADAVAFYQKSGQVEYAEPDYIVSIDLTPNDTNFGSLWGLHNTGQTGGTADADIDAPEAWNIRTDASAVIVAVIDTGVRYTHEDLAANMWTNPGEIPGNGIDDDGNGLIDDVYGAKYVGTQVSGDPMDDNGHGSHCSGTIGGVGNNGKGVAGVCWKVKIMAMKFLNTSGSGATSDAVKCIDYAISKGANVMSNSWGGGGYSTTLYNAINRARAAGIVFVAAAGNSGTNNDTAPFYPANYGLDNIISVAATDSNDGMASFSNYGLTTVHLGAPGVGIYSCYKTSDTSYTSLSGTSMATPHVSGACATVKAQFPGLTYLQLKNVILSSVDALSSLAGKTVTGGRLNLFKALSNGNPAQIAVTPASQRFGAVTIGMTADFGFTVENKGGQPLSGSASVPLPFKVVGGSPYNVPAGGSTVVTVRFEPTAVGASNQTVTFTGGGGTTAAVSGTGQDYVGNHPPVVTITSPQDSSTYSTTDWITFTGTANDLEDGNLTANLLWISSIDGVIGNGGSFTAQLAAGTHVITAEVTDSGSLTGSKTITITVNAPTSPAAPSNLKAAVSGSTVTLTWSDNSSNETNFAIERKAQNGSFTQIGTVGANVKTYTNSGVPRGNYSYRVRAYNGAGYSPYSNTASAKVK